MQNKDIALLAGGALIGWIGYSIYSNGSTSASVPVPTPSPTRAPEQTNSQPNVTRQPLSLIPRQRTELLTDENLRPLALASDSDRPQSPIVEVIQRQLNAIRATVNLPPIDVNGILDGPTRMAMNHFMENINGVRDLIRRLLASHASIADANQRAIRFSRDVIMLLDGFIARMNAPTEGAGS